MVSPATLAALSPLGHPRTSVSRELFRCARVAIAEPAWTPTWSLRQSRTAADAAALAAAFAALARVRPERPNALAGTAEAGCGWLEPHAWVLTGALPSAAGLPGSLLLTDISDRTAAFVATGPGASDLIAAGCDPRMVGPGTMARTRFGGIATVIVQRWADQEYRLLVDVSIAPAFAAWMAHAVAAV